MADSVSIAGLALPQPHGGSRPRHSAVVRITHWIGALSFVGLTVSGVGIILAHPRFYWGETGGVGTPSLFDLPLPFMLGGPSGWGRYLHFESAWLFVFNLLLYVSAGIATRHFTRDLIPERSQLSWREIVSQGTGNNAHTYAHTYNFVQRITYLTVVFLLFPLMVWTGLAMSPSVTSVFPWLVNVLGGHQTARTIHFFAAVALVLFVFVHVAMVWRAGFRARVGAMITGNAGTREEM